MILFGRFVLTPGVGREISDEVAARTDELNEFPADMWKKLGDAGYAIPGSFAIAFW